MSPFESALPRMPNVWPVPPVRRVMPAASHDADVHFVLIGEMVAVRHGHVGGVTVDVSVAPVCAPDNLGRLATATRASRPNIGKEARLTRYQLRSTPPACYPVSLPRVPRTEALSGGPPLIVGDDDPVAGEDRDAAACSPPAGSGNCGTGRSHRFKCCTTPR